MVETLVASECPRVWWYRIIVPIVAVWSLLISVLLNNPMVQYKIRMPKEELKKPSRYRLCTPKPVVEEETSPAESVPPSSPIDGISNESSSSCAAEDSPPEDQSSSEKKRRRNSVFSYFTPSKKTTTRARSGSDPTGRSSGVQAFYERAAERTKKYMNSAANIATTPTRPLVKRARSIVQKSMESHKGVSEDMDNSDDERGDKKPRSSTRKFFESSRNRTSRAFRRFSKVDKKDKPADVAAGSAETKEDF